jgi:hypothetical protein
MTCIAMPSIDIHTYTNKDHACHEVMLKCLGFNVSWQLKHHSIYVPALKSTDNQQRNISLAKIMLEGVYKMFNKHANAIFMHRNQSLVLSYVLPVLAPP